MSTSTTFDPIKFKTTTRAQWENAAEAWHCWGPFLGEWLGPATERILDLANVQTGSRVLDVAAGAGEQTLRAARRAGTLAVGGRVRTLRARIVRGAASDDGYAVRRRARRYLARNRERTKEICRRERLCRPVRDAGGGGGQVSQ